MAKKPGLAQADEPTKKMVSELGNEAQGHHITKESANEPEVVEIVDEEVYMVIDPRTGQNVNEAEDLVEEDEEKDVSEPQKKAK